MSLSGAVDNAIVSSILKTGAADSWLRELELAMRDEWSLRAERGELRRLKMLYHPKIIHALMNGRGLFLDWLTDCDEDEDGE